MCAHVSQLARPHHPALSYFSFGAQEPLVRGPGPMKEASFFLPSRSSTRIVCFSPLNCGLSCTLFLMAVATVPLNALPSVLRKRVA